MSDSDFVLFGGAVVYLILGFTPIPSFTALMIISLFDGRKKLREKFLMVLGGAPIWGLYVILVSSAIDRWTYWDDPLSCFVWLGCLHFLYIQHLLRDRKS